MNIKNNMLNKSFIASSAIVLSLSLAATTVSAHEGGYASGGNGKVLRDGSGNCVRATYGNAYPECEPVVIPPAPVAVMIKPMPKPIVVKPKLIIKPKPQYITRILSLNESEGANFAFDSDNLSSKGQNQLATFANSVKSSNISPSSVSIVGHTDSIGSKAYNQKLSERRANSVASYLSSRGISRSVMQVSGQGESRPTGSNKTAEGRAQNRRVDIRVTGQRKVTIRK